MTMTTVKEKEIIGIAAADSEKQAAKKAAPKPAKK